MVSDNDIGIGQLLAGLVERALPYVGASTPCTLCVIARNREPLPILQHEI